ncbi:hypothetical protein Y032_0010g1184 [Ancylostoma ceylanicum]|uniref:Uncharacterized protein n=1 Tax=Ancylostoma ceylanicum TaxID=53326 RepID=A0A016VFT2_9BILA|nr:hypothetical protein Y032_0010g1184 [Ancylostoma ceylanicum]
MEPILAASSPFNYPCSKQNAVSISLNDGYNGRMAVLAVSLIGYYHRQSFYLRNRTKTAIDGGTNSNTWRSLSILLKELDFAALKTTAL